MGYIIELAAELLRSAVVCLHPFGSVPLRGDQRDAERGAKRELTLAPLLRGIEVPDPRLTGSALP